MTRRFRSLLLVVVPLAASLGCSQDSPFAPTSPIEFTFTVRVVDAASVPVPGATVEIEGLSIASLLSDEAGLARVEMTAESNTPLTVRVSREGFRTFSAVWYTPRLEGGSAGGTATLTSTSILDLSNLQFMTIAADESCTHLPPSVRERRCAISDIRTNNGSFNFRMAAFALGRDVAYGTRSGDSVAFMLGTIDDLAGWDFPLIERLTEDTYLQYFGTVQATTRADAPNLTGSFDGAITYCSASDGRTIPTCVVPPVVCSSLAHRVVITRG